MSLKNTTDVIIGGKVFKISGCESEEYIQKLATYINNKISEYHNQDSYRRQSSEVRATMLYINIADDYFKEKKTGDDLQAEVESKNTQIYDLKHDLVSEQMKNEKLLAQIKSLKEDINKHQKNIVRLETELKDIKNKDLKK